MYITVYNKQQYAIARGGHVFAPQVETEIEVGDAKKLAEIRACVYLRVKSNEPVAQAATGEDTILPDALDSMTKAQLIAAYPDLGLSERDTRSDIIAAINATSEAI